MHWEERYRKRLLLVQQRGRVSKEEESGNPKNATVAETETQNNKELNFFFIMDV